MATTKFLRTSSTNLFLCNMACSDFLSSALFPWIVLCIDLYQHYILGSFICQTEGTLRGMWSRQIMDSHQDCDASVREFSMAYVGQRAVVDGRQFRPFRQDLPPFQTPVITLALSFMIIFTFMRFQIYPMHLKCR